MPGPSRIPPPPETDDDRKAKKLAADNDARAARKSEFYTKQRKDAEAGASIGDQKSIETLKKIRGKMGPGKTMLTVAGDTLKGLTDSFEKSGPIAGALLGARGIASKGGAASKIIGEAEKAGTQVAKAASKPSVRRFATEKTKPELDQMRYNQLRNPGGSVRAKPGSAQAGKVTAKNPEPAEAQGPRRPTSVGRRVSGNVGSGKGSGYFKDPPVKPEAAAKPTVSKTRVSVGRSPANRPAFGEKPANASLRTAAKAAKEAPKVSAPAAKSLRVSPKGKTLAARPTMGEKPANASFKTSAAKPQPKSELQKTLEKSVKQAKAKRKKAA